MTPSCVHVSVPGVVGVIPPSTSSQKISLSPGLPMCVSASDERLAMLLALAPVRANTDYLLRGRPE
jgi:hypothetical protein